MTHDPLAVVDRNAAAARIAIEDRDAAISAAHAAGFTLREIGQAAGLSHQTVKNILDREDKRMKPTHCPVCESPNIEENDPAPGEHTCRDCGEWIEEATSQ